MKTTIPYLRVHIEHKVQNLSIEEDLRRLRRMIRERKSVPGWIRCAINATDESKYIVTVEAIEEKQTTPQNSDDEDVDLNSEEFIERAIKKYRDEILARNARIEKEIEEERLKQEQMERNQKLLESLPPGEMYEGKLADKVYTPEELEALKQEALKTMLSPNLPPPKLWKLDRKYTQFCEMHEKVSL